MSRDEKEFDRKEQARLDEMYDAIYDVEESEGEMNQEPTEGEAKAWMDGYLCGVLAEREECAKLLDEMDAKDRLSNYYKVAAVLVRERGAP
jgi:hypothetical protein